MTDAPYQYFSGERSTPPPPPLRVITGDPSTFDWYRGFGAGPVIHLIDGSAVGPVLVESKVDRFGGELTRWETVEVRPPISSTTTPQSTRPR